MQKNKKNTARGRSLKEIAGFVDGKLSGDAGKLILAAAPFETAGSDDITFAGQAKYIQKLDGSSAGAVLVPMNVSCATANIIRVNNPKLAFIKVLGLFHPPSRLPVGIHQAAVTGKNFSCGKDSAIGAGVVIQDHVSFGDRVQIHPNVVIGDRVELGDDVIVYPNVTILDRCKIGNRVIIHSGSVIGSDGFGFESDGQRFHKIPQLGIVQIDDDVEIGANNTIDRAAFDKTWIRSGVKTDNLVHIAHNVVVGENTVLVAQAGIAGSTRLGKNVIMAGQSGAAGHISIGDRVMVGPKAGVLQSTPERTMVSGFPAIPHRLWLRVQRVAGKLPELFKQVADLEKRIRKIEKKPD